MQLLPEMRAGLRSAVEVGQGEMFVGTVQIVAVPAPAQQECIESQNAAEAAYDRDRAPLANHDRIDGERAFDRAPRRRQVMLIGLEDECGRTMPRREFQREAGG